MSETLTLPVEVADRIEQTLTRLRRMTEAECVLLADISGQLISVLGQMERGDPALVAALAASDVAAMAELSRQIGEENPYGAFLHEGKHKSIYLFSTAESFILIVVFRADTPVGLVRLFAGRAAGELQELAPEFERLLGQPVVVPGAEFGAALADEMERAFSGF